MSRAHLVVRETGSLQELAQDEPRALALVVKEWKTGQVVVPSMLVLTLASLESLYAAVGSACGRAPARLLLECGALLPRDPHVHTRARCACATTTPSFAPAQAPVQGLAQGPVQGPVQVLRPPRRAARSPCGARAATGALRRANTSTTLGLRPVSTCVGTR
jgi:hypothetical protein